MTGSFLAERLSHYVALTAAENAALGRLEGQPRALKRGTILQQEHDRATDAYIVRQGWLHSYVLLDDGSRQILRLHLPGELAGASGVAFVKATESIAALTDVVICPFDKAALSRTFVDHPRLAALIYLISQAERVALTDRLASLGRTSAKARVAALLLDTLDRLRAMNPDLGPTIVFPLTQEEIGDATGLTAVHVNRMMRVLVEEGLIARSGTSLCLLDEQRLRRISNHVNRHADFDTSWLPPAS
ncbi:Crp/Fnr family transcriptional regulator [Sphingomonas sp. 1P06PA]|uniref:Crp/Fnr family transcriptional regulator n=1 Tax=Sphingomonas sp. 1P06PA TaxID=554121 RepID=UPI0039A701F9